MSEAPKNVFVKMTEDNDLVKRLRKRQEFEFIDGYKRIEWEDNDALEAADRIEALEAEKDWYRDHIVWGFYEDAEPKYYQGKAGEHEICDPVTAKEVTCLLSKLNNAEAALEEMRELFFERMGAQKSHPLAWEYYTGEKSGDKP